MQLLVRLALQPGAVVTREELLDAVWPNQLVTDDAITGAVRKLRRAFGEGPRRGAVVETVPKVGYRLVARVERLTSRRRTGPARGAGDIPPLPGDVTIAVLPFVNLGAEPGFNRMADGFTEDVTTALARIPSLSVAARTSTTPYKSRAEDAGEIGRALRVRHLLEGSVQTHGERVRVTARLIDVGEGHLLWAHHYDRDLGDLLALQDEISLDIVAATEIELTEGYKAACRRRQSDALEAYVAHRRGIEYLRRFTPEDQLQAKRWLDHAVSIDPGFVTAWLDLGWVHMIDAAFEWSAEPLESLSIAEHIARKALRLGPDEAEVHALLGKAAMHRRRFDEARCHCEQVVNWSGGDGLSLGCCASALVLMDEPDKALSLLYSAVRLTPRCPDWFLVEIGKALYALGRHPEAIDVFDRLRTAHPDWDELDIYIAASASHTGSGETARRSVERILRHDPSACAESCARLPFVSGWHQHRDRTARHIEAALRKAGLPA